REHLLVARIVHAATAPGVAAEQAPGCEHCPLEEAELPVGLDCVLRAGGVVLAAAGPEEGSQRQPIGPDRSDAQISHAAAFDSTSSTRSLSQSNPFAATASGSPGFAIRT